MAGTAAGVSTGGGERSSSSSTSASAVIARGGDAPFQDAFASFMGRVSAYNTTQRQQLYQLMIRSFSEVLSQFPAPRVEAREAPSSPPASDARASKQLVDVELVIADKLYQVCSSTRHGQRVFFQRFDIAKQGSLAPPEFKAAIASLGITLSDREIGLLLDKYDTDGDSRLSYDEFLKFVNARREHHPRSSAKDAYSSAMHGRPAARAEEVSDMVRTLEAPLEVRIAKGLKHMRELIYCKSQTLYPLFKLLKNDANQVTITVLVPKLTKYGFPTGLATEDQLRAVAAEYAKVRAGSLTYPEFVRFFSGNERAEEEESKASWAENSNFVAVLVTVNNQNLRKLFRQLDHDADGLITTVELMEGLTQFGLSPAMADNLSFMAFAEEFAQRKTGHFLYSEFIRFINQRKHGQATKIAGEPLHKKSVTIDPSLPLLEVMDALRKHVHENGISVETACEVYDKADGVDDGTLPEISELSLALSDMGVTMHPSTIQQIWDALVPEGEQLNIQEFARAVANPLRSSKLTSAATAEAAAAGGVATAGVGSGSVGSISRAIRVSPGGESSIPLGAYAADQKDPATRSLVATGVAPGGESSFDFKMGPTPWVPPRGPPSKRNQSDVKLTFDPHGIDTTPSRLSSRKHPPGGGSVVDFAKDHGASMERDPRSIKDPIGGRSSVVFGTEGATPHTPARPTQRRTTGGTPGGPSSISFDSTGEPLPSPRPMKSYFGPPGGESQVSMNHQDFEEYKPGLKRLGPAGGSSTMDLAFDPDREPPPTARPIQGAGAPRATGDPMFSIAFDPTGPPDSARRYAQAPGGTSTVSLAHPTRAGPVDASPSARSASAGTKGRTAPGGQSSMTSLGSDHSRDVLSAYAAPTREHDWDVLIKVSDAIFARGRLRHTFQELTKSTKSTLTKAGFQSGMASVLGVTLTPSQVDQLYERFDADQDGELTYSEFVRLVATSDRQPKGGDGSATPTAVAGAGAADRDERASGAATPVPSPRGAPRASPRASS